jgi:signal transduction histidine kinase
MGLRIMQERAAGIGATVTVSSEVERGTEIRAIWPAHEGIIA